MVHSHLGAVKKDEQLTYMTLHVYAYDSTPSKPTLVRRGVVAVSSCHWYTFINRCYLLLWAGRGSDFAVDSSVVGTIMWSQKCDSKRCMMCRHLVEGSCFVSNTTNRSFHVLGSDAAMTCSTCNVVYLISCKRCGLQYVGDESIASL